MGTINSEMKTDWTQARAVRAKESLRKQVEVVRDGTHMADGPLVLHKSIYTSQTRFEAEREHIFLNQPLVACLTGDVPNPGDRIIYDAAGPSIIVSRGKDGVARAFLNMCPHRGAKLIEQSEPYASSGKKISCPFHAWTFDTSGNLVGQPGKEGFTGCDIGSRNMIEVPCAEHLGLILVRANPDGDPIDVSAHVGSFAPELALMELHRAEPVKKGILLADSNWKFALDTYGESYHFSTLHKSSIAKVNYNNKCVYEPFEKHYRVQYPKFFVGDLIDQAESDWPETIHSGVHYLFPNTIIYFGAINPGEFFVQVFRLYPDGVGKTRCHFAVYAPFGVGSDAEREMCETNYDLTSTVVVDEDYRVAAGGYANLIHAPADFSVVLGANEIALHGVHKYIADAIGIPLDVTD